jgi:hypothetical protein
MVEVVPGAPASSPACCPLSRGQCSVDELPPRRVPRRYSLASEGEKPLSSSLARRWMNGARAPGRRGSSASRLRPRASRPLFPGDMVERGMEPPTPQRCLTPPALQNVRHGRSHGLVNRPPRISASHAAGRPARWRHAWGELQRPHGPRSLGGRFALPRDAAMTV